MIASTFANNSTKLQIVTNGFGFTGLTLDILGACFGVLHAIKLQNAIQHPPELLRPRSKQDFEDIVDGLLKRVEEEGDAALQEVSDTLQAENSERKKFWTDRRFSEFAWHNEPLHRHLEPLFGPRLFPILSPIQRFIHQPGPTHSEIGEPPMLAMGAGMMCLLISVICFAAYSQRRPVWVICIVVTFLASLICFSPLLEGSKIGVYSPFLNAPCKICLRL